MLLLRATRGGMFILNASSLPFYCLKPISVLPMPLYCWDEQPVLHGLYYSVQLLSSDLDNLISLSAQVVIGIVAKAIS
jgi:hypothetical protein